MARAPRPSNPATYLSPAPPRVFAHRGLAVEAPENTLLAFARAMAAGASYIETDVHASADGIAVIAHDPDLKRVAGRDVRVGQLTIAELRRVDLGHGQAFCSLAEALDAFPDARFNIDIKSMDAVAPTIDAVTAARAIPRVLVTSFSDRRRRLAVAGLPGVATSASAGSFLGALIAGKLRSAALVRRALRGVVAVQVPERALGLRVTTERMLAQLHAASVEMHVWTINDPERMRELLELGVDGIVTDRADLALEVVRNL